MNVRGKKFSVRVKPKSHKSGVEIQADGSLVVRVRAVASEGKANEELIQVLAEFLEVPRSSIEIVSGRASKQKIVKLN